MAGASTTWRFLKVGVGDQHTGGKFANDKLSTSLPVGITEDRSSVGKHAAESGLDLKAYAEQAGKGYDNLKVKARAFRVMTEGHVSPEDARDSWRNLAEIHAAPQWLWKALVGRPDGHAVRR